MEGNIAHASCYFSIFVADGENIKSLSGLLKNEKSVSCPSTGESMLCHYLLILLYCSEEEQEEEQEIEQDGEQAGDGEGGEKITFSSLTCYVQNSGADIILQPAYQPCHDISAMTLSH